MLASDAYSFDRPIDGRVLHQAGQPLVGGRLEAKEDVEVVCDRAPGLEQLWMCRDKVGPALHQQPPFPDAAPPQRVREFDAAGRLIPEQIVGDEDVRSGRREVVAHALDRAEPNDAVVHGPDRAEGASERAAARGLDQPYWPKQQAGVLTTPRVDVAALRGRHLVEREGAV